MDSGTRTPVPTPYSEVEDRTGNGSDWTLSTEWDRTTTFGGLSGVSSPVREGSVPKPRRDYPTHVKDIWIGLGVGPGDRPSTEVSLEYPSSVS